MEINWNVIIEDGKTEYLKTRASDLVIRTMLIKYIELYPEREEDMSFGKFLRYNGIECIYDGTHGYFDIDRERSADKNE